MRTAGRRRSGGPENAARTCSAGPGTTVGAADSRPEGDVLAIVGSQHWPTPGDLEEAWAAIEGYLTSRRPDRIVTRGAQGIDTLAEQVAGEYGIPVTVLPPRRRQGDGPDGPRAPNEAIVAACTRLLVIGSASSTTDGLGWTAALAERTGRPVRRHQVPAAASLPGTGPASVSGGRSGRALVQDGEVRNLFESDAGLTELLGPKCGQCGWRVGTKDEPRPHRPGCPRADAPPPVA